MKRKFNIFYSERLKKNYIPKYFLSDRLLSDTDFFKKIKSNNFFKNYKKMNILKKLNLD